MKKHLISGLVFLLPIAITLAIINFFVNLLTQPFHNLFSQLLQLTGAGKYDLIVHSSSLFILICLFLITLLIGTVGNWFVSHQIIRLGERLVARIPLVGTVYKASKDVIHTLINSPTSSFQRVVMVPFPSDKSYCLGLLVKASENLANEELLSVFVPTTPNPTTGFLLMFPKKCVRDTDISVEDALKYIISCGMILPPNAPNGLKASDLHSVTPETPLSHPVKYNTEYLADTAPSHLPSDSHQVDRVIDPV